MESYCGINCDECPIDTCRGCKKTKGSPFGGKCVLCKYLKDGNSRKFNALKRSLIKEVNALGIKGLKIDDLNALCGSYVNIEYPMPNSKRVKLLDDKNIYLGNQVEIRGKKECFGIVCDDSFIMVAQYKANGKDPKLVLYKSR